MHLASTPPKGKLDSWKEIAVYLSRDESTVRRWEQTRGLPIHRVPGGKRNAVFAYTDEITRWLEGGETEQARAAAPERLPAEGVESPDSRIPTASRFRAAAAFVRSSPGGLAAAATVLLIPLALIAAVTAGRRHPSTPSPRPTAAAARTRAVGPNASAAYLRGRYLLDQRTTEGIIGAVDAFTQAVLLDPQFAAGYAGLADAYTVMGMAAAPNTEMLPKAKAAVTRALELDPQLADAHTSLAAIHALYEWDWAAADREFTRALELDPNYALAHYWRGAFCLSTLGHHDEAIGEIRRAEQIDPVALHIKAGLGQAYYFARQYDRALTEARETLALNPTFEPALALVEHSLREKRMFAEAAAVNTSFPMQFPFAKPIDSPDKPDTYQMLVRYRAHNREAEAPRRHVSPYWLAYYYAAAGDAEVAMRWLTKAFEQRHPALVFVGVEPVFDALRHDARFQAIAREVGAWRRMVGLAGSP